MAFREAIKEASKNINYYEGVCRANGKKYRSKSSHGALLIKNKSVVSRGFNKPGFNKVPAGYKNIHAECMAIISAQEAGDIIFVIRVGRNGELTCSRPCEKCMAFMKEHKIRKVYYSDWDGTIKKEKL